MPNPTDPLFSSQWHLQNNTPGLLDLNVTRVWNDYTGAGVSVFVFDDGFDYLHADLAPNWDASRSYDYGNFTSFPYGSDTDSHGTAVMGIIGAAGNNGIGGAGIAYGATLVGYRDYDTSFFNVQNFVDTIDDIFLDAVDDGADVINISQGISNTSDYVLGVGLYGSWINDLYGALEYAVDTGRGGLGTIMVKSAGNARAANFDANASPWAANTHQIVVAAVDQNGFVSDYSTHGASNLISGFGTPGEVVTTDRRGAAGYDPGDVTYGFNGTSAAAPMVSGVIALMLEANPDLGWRDVQNILAASARHVGSAVGGWLQGAEQYAWTWNGATNWNGGAMHYSNDYGFGLIDALAAVRLAETWHQGDVAQVSGNETMVSGSRSFGQGEVIDGVHNNGLNPVSGSGSETYSIRVAGGVSVERVTLAVTFSSTYIGEIGVTLISPDGTEIVMLPVNLPNGHYQYNGQLRFEAQGFRGELSGGLWQVRLTDTGWADTPYYSNFFVVNQLNIKVHGDADTTNDRYVFTDEFSDYVNSGRHAPVLSDTDGGIDTVNAAAVTSDTRLDLRNGKISVIDGVNVTTQGNTIENAVTGDGNDVLRGNGLNNILSGERGNDKLFGFAGHDTLHGGNGRDTLNGGRGNDKLYGGAGNDRIYGDEGKDSLYGGAGGDRLYGGEGNDKLYGAGGNDVLDGGAGQDKLYGGAGQDKLYGFAGDDQLYGGAGRDKLFGGDGSDVLNGGGGGDRLLGGAGNDVLRGGGGRDYMDGGAGNDKLLGGAGNDVLRGGTGNDVLTGGGGADTFVYAKNWDADRITDFTDNVDTLCLDDALWGGGKTVQQVISQFASVQGGDVVFNFGNGDTLRLVGWNTTSGLANDIDLF